MQDWERTLAHAKAVRDAHVAAGHIPPSKSDPIGGITAYGPIRSFNGKAFFKALEGSGHDKAELARCCCQRG
jgi:hypothetical protein